MPLSDSLQDVLDTARKVYLNDVNGSTYTNAVLLPFCKIIYDKYQSELQLHGLQFTMGIYTIKIGVGGKFLRLPGDFMYPIKLEERAITSTRESDFVELSGPTRWVDSRDPQIELLDWCYLDGEIKFVGATSERLVKLYYQKSFPNIQDAKLLVQPHCISYLAAKLAAYVHMFIAQNQTLADIANSDAETELNKLIGIAIKKVQSQIVRRRPYIPFWRN